MPRGYRDHRRRAPRILGTLLGLLTLTIAACASPSSGQATLASNQVFTWPFVFAVDSIGGPGKTLGETFDPAIIQNAADLGTVAMIYSGLVTFDSSLHVVPDAASSWDISSDGSEYTFHLRTNMHFSDGTPLTAADYAYSINRALDPAICTAQDAQTYGPGGTGVCQATPDPGVSPADNPPIASSYLGYILGAQQRLSGSGGSDHSLIGSGDDPNHGLDVIDQYTLRIRLTKPVAFFLEALTYPTSFPVEQSLVKKYPNGLWVDHLDEGGCSGPFMVKSYGDGKQLTLVKNPYWETAWGKTLTLTEVDRPLVQSMEDEYTSYRTGQYDYSDVPGNSATSAQSQPGFNEIPVLQINYFGLNFAMPPFDNLQVRQAFDLALNKQLLVDSILHGTAIPTNHIVPRGMPGFNANLRIPDGDSPTSGSQSVTGNQTQAQTLLDQVIKDCNTNPSDTKDWCPYLTNKDQSSPIQVWYPAGSATRRETTQGAVADWNQIFGLNIQAKGEPDANAYFGNLSPNGPYQAWNVGWLADYPDPQDWLSLQFHSNQADNASNVHIPSLDAQMDQADTEQNPTTRINDYNAIEQQMVWQNAWIPYDQPEALWLQRTWVHGFSLNELLIMSDINWPNVYIAAHSGS